VEPLEDPDHLQPHVEHDDDEDEFELLGGKQMGRPGLGEGIPGTPQPFVM